MGSRTTFVICDVYSCVYTVWVVGCVCVGGGGPHGDQDYVCVFMQLYFALPPPPPQEPSAGGPHNPLLELLFPQFLEALVRLSALRYRTLPGLERRVHHLINNHLLHMVR